MSRRSDLNGPTSQSFPGSNRITRRDAKNPIILQNFRLIPARAIVQNSERNISIYITVNLYKRREVICNVCASAKNDKREFRGI